ncbi:hypothetical protein ES689_12805 [Frigoribacterium sp. ACAM 257]|uniref:hypothetical protein n=1 Tax=Frigoribacterium sp. ACAM 257 TaxID=2508998 RepID=UPI0011B9F129|nr:hypothetical protein [Frigoribacterium sp. ACAM 257]TWX36274.1 hypothetical protein ES689_12805 [Frigoribacterium sp. ACAM 257]
MDERRSWIREHVLEAPRRRTLLWMFVAMTVAFGGSMGTFFGASSSFSAAPVPLATSVTLGVALGLVSGLFFGASMTLVVAWLWAQHGGAEQAERIGRAIRVGRLPEGADTSGWAPILARQEAWARRGAWLFTLEFVVFALLSALLAALPPGPPDDIVPTWVPWAGVVFFGVVAVLNPLLSLRRARRIRALRDQLPTGEDSARPL